MVVLYNTGDIVFCYKDIQWPILSIASQKRGFIGIRPFLRDVDYSTRSFYYHTNEDIWYFSLSLLFPQGFRHSRELRRPPLHVHDYRPLFPAPRFCLLPRGALRFGHHRTLSDPLRGFGGRFASPSRLKL